MKPKKREREKAASNSLMQRSNPKKTSRAEHVSVMETSDSDGELGGLSKKFKFKINNRAKPAKFLKLIESENAEGNERKNKFSYINDKDS